MHQPATNVTLGEAPTWDELFENGYPLNREALLLTDALDHLEVVQTNNTAITFGNIRQCAIGGTSGDEQKDAQIKKLSTFVILKAGYENEHVYIPPNLRQTICAPIVLLDSIYKTFFIAIHDLRNSKKWERLWQYGKDHKIEYRVDGLMIRFATKNSPIRACRNVFFSEDDLPRRIEFEQHELKPTYERTTFMTQSHRLGQTWTSMSPDERAQQTAVSDDIRRVTSGEYIHKAPEPGEELVRTGGLQRMNTIDNRTVPNIEIREEWFAKHATRRGVEQDRAEYSMPGQMSIRQRLEGATGGKD